MPKTHITSPQASTAIDRLALGIAYARDGGAEAAANLNAFLCAEPTAYTPTSSLSSCMADD
jgi:hypothetical protein